MLRILAALSILWHFPLNRTNFQTTRRFQSSWASEICYTDGCRPSIAGEGSWPASLCQEAMCSHGALSAEGVEFLLHLFQTGWHSSIFMYLDPLRMSMLRPGTAAWAYNPHTREGEMGGSPTKGWGSAYLQRKCHASQAHIERLYLPKQDRRLRI